MGHKVAYIMSRFPHLPETFILREMNALEAHGWRISLYPLIRQKQTVIHDEASAWVERARYTPFVSRDVLKANFQAFIKRPFRYLKTGIKAILENFLSPKFFVRALLLFPKAVLMAQQMQAEGVQHIHAHYATHPALVAWIIHQLSGLGYSVTVHAHDIFVDQTMLKTKLHAATFVVAISDFNRQYLGAVVGEHFQEKIHIVHCGIQPSWYHQSGEEVMIAEDRLEIINVGSLQPYKGHIHLLKACAILKEERIPFRCRIIGEGGQREHLERFIASKQLHNDVLVLGALSQDRVAELLPTAHCYVQPSVITPSGKMEGIPVALMEAFAAELPIVATEISGIPELVRPGETGFLVPPEDANALAEAIKFISQNWGNAKRMAIAGRKLVLEEFDLKKNVEILSAYFQEAILE